MRLGWPAFFVFFYVYRVVLSVIGEAYVSQITSLGDSISYQGRGVFQGSGGRFDTLFSQDSSLLTEGLGALFGALSFGNPYLVNVWFQTLAFIGIYKFMTAVEPQTRKFVALLAVMPSFNIWSSIASKEAVIVFAVGVLCAFIVDLLHNRARLHWYYLFATYIIYVYKPHFAPALAFIIGTMLVARHVREKASVVLAFGVVSLAVLYVFRDAIDALAFEAMLHFPANTDSFSTRPGFWVEQYDVFWKAPYGVLQGFYGPTFGEALSGHAMLVFSFVESFFIIAILLYCLLRRLPELPLYNFLLWLFGTFWILFANYPLGIMNPGSAVRYRAGYLLLVVLLFTVVLSRDVFVRWRDGWQTRRDGSVIP
jgi:hypothetical protein